MTTTKKLTKYQQAMIGHPKEEQTKVKVNPQAIGGLTFVSPPWVKKTDNTNTKG